MAKAPRKSLPRVNVTPTSSSTKRKVKVATGGNPLKLWPTPKGQNELTKFFGSASPSSSGSGSSGCCSSSSSEEQNCEPGCSKADTSPDVSPVPSPTPIAMLDDITQLNSDSEGEDD